MDQTGKNTVVEVCNWDGLLNSFYGSCQNFVCGTGDSNFDHLYLNFAPIFDNSKARAECRDRRLPGITAQHDLRAMVCGL